MTGRRYMLSLLLLATLSAQAHAGQFWDWLIENSGPTIVNAILKPTEYCAQVIVGTRRGPLEERQFRREMKEAEELAAQVNELLDQMIMTKQDRYKTAKANFLDGFGAERRAQAHIPLQVFNADDSDAEDVSNFRELLSGFFPSLRGEQFERLVQVILARAGFFDSPVSVLNTIALIQSQTDGRDLNSRNIALLQIGMLRSVNDFKNDPQVVQAHRIIFADWALPISRTDFAMVQHVALSLEPPRGARAIVQAFGARLSR